MYDNQNKMQKVIIERNNSLKMDYPNLRARRFNRYFYEGETCRQINELPYKYFFKFTLQVLFQIFSNF